MKNCLSRSQGIIFTPRCADSFPHEELQAFANITDVIKAYEQGLVAYSVVPVEILSRVVFMKLWTTFFIRLAFKQ